MPLASPDAFFAAAKAKPAIKEYGPQKATGTNLISDDGQVFESKQHLTSEEFANSCKNVPDRPSQKAGKGDKKMKNNSAAGNNKASSIETDLAKLSFSGSPSKSLFGGGKKITDNKEPSGLEASNKDVIHSAAGEQESSGHTASKGATDKGTEGNSDSSSDDTAKPISVEDTEDRRQQQSNSNGAGAYGNSEKHSCHDIIRFSTADLKIEYRKSFDEDADNALTRACEVLTNAEPLKSYKELLNEPGKYSVKATHAGMKNVGQRWAPRGVCQMKPFKPTSLATTPIHFLDLEVFKGGFLKSILGGVQWSDGVYLTEMSSYLDGNTYYLLDTAIESHAPNFPGQHGAKLSLFYNNFDDPAQQLVNVPLFIRLVAPGPHGFRNDWGYLYLGHYSQTRWSDKLDYDTQETHVLMQTKQYWAALCTCKNRPEWIVQQLKEALVPMPQFPGTVPVHITGFQHEASKAEVGEYLEDLVEWSIEADTRVANLTYQEVMDAFKKSDGDEEPGLRLSWEYLECQKFDRNFYYALASAQRKQMGDGERATTTHAVLLRLEQERDWVQSHVEQASRSLRKFEAEGTQD